MSAVKIFALGVMVIGTSGSPTPAGSIRSGLASPTAAGPSFTPPTSRAVAQSSQSPVPSVSSAPTPTDSPVIAEANLAGGPADQGFGNPGNSTMQGQPGGAVLHAGTLYLGTNQLLTIGGPPNSDPGSNAQAAPAPAPQMGLPAPVVPADAFINFGAGPFPEADTLTQGNAQPFSSSPAFRNLFKNGPTTQDIATFEAQVIATIQKTYDDAGLHIRLTTNPGQRAAHTLSVVSGTSNPNSPNAVGITDVGNNGFSFIDKFADAQKSTQLATAVGHNVAHELMHAFGLSNHPEAVGPYVDAASTTLASLTDPNTDFSPVAAALLSTLNFQATGESITAGAQRIDGDQILIPEARPVPEPSTVALWALAGGVAVLARRRRRRPA